MLGSAAMSVVTLLLKCSSASKNTDSSVFYTEIETKILNTDSDPKNTDRDPITVNYSDLNW